MVPAATSAPSERRHALRSPAPCSAELLIGGERQLCELVDLSSTGARLIGVGPLRRMQRVVVLLHLPAGICSAVATVAWVDPRARAAGIYFGAVSSEMVERLRAGSTSRDAAPVRQVVVVGLEQRLCAELE